MAGVILESVTNKQLIMFTLMLLGVQVIFFIIGGTIAPAPTSAMVHIAHICIDREKNPDVIEFMSPWECEKIQSMDDAKNKIITADQIVFAVQFPHRELDMSRWHQFVVGTIELEIGNKIPISSNNPVVTLDLLLGAKDKGDKSWKKLGQSREKREHNCQLEGTFYNCEDIPVFELGSCHYDTYLLNIRLPTKNNSNRDIGQVESVNFVEIHQNGGFTRVWFSLKTILTPLIILTLVWFKRRINRLPRSPYLFETTIFLLGITLAGLDFPLEWLTLWFDMPYMLLISDIRQGIFYAALLCFWLIFAGEHVMDQTQRNSLKAYRKEIVAVLIGSLSLLIFDLCERGVQLSNPFHSIWATKSGKKAAMGFLIFAAICTCLYFLFFLVMMVKVFWHIGGKRSHFSRMSAARRVAYEGAFYRFKFLLAFTIICAALTIAFFITTNVNEAHWKFGEKQTVEISSAFIAGIYGLWNIYVFAILVLYAPSSQALSTNTIEVQEDTDESVEVFSDTQRFVTQSLTSETSLIYSIAGKGNID